MPTPTLRQWNAPYHWTPLNGSLLSVTLMALLKLNRTLMNKTTLSPFMMTSKNNNSLKDINLASK